jgi:hypothetical protein
MIFTRLLHGFLYVWVCLSLYVCINYGYKYGKELTGFPQVQYGQHVTVGNFISVDFNSLFYNNIVTISSNGGS